MDFTEDLLDIAGWPDALKRHTMFPVLKNAAEFSLSLVEQINIDKDDDSRLHNVFTSLAAIVPQLPHVKSDRPPAYMRNAWDLRALSTMIPSGLRLQIDQEAAPDEDGDARWTASLFDNETAKLAGHPSEVMHNKVLTYDSGDYSEAWSANVALARILIVAYLLAAVVQILQPGTNDQLGSGLALPDMAQ